MLLIYINFIVFCNFIENYKIILIFSFFCGFVVLIIPFITYLVALKLRSCEKITPYECGYESFEDSRGFFEIHFLVITILFILFDLEIAFIFPWIKIVYILGFRGFWNMSFLLLLLSGGFYFEWRKGALNWLTEVPNNLLY